MENAEMVEIVYADTGMEFSCPANGMSYQHLAEKVVENFRLGQGSFIIINENGVVAASATVIDADYCSRNSKTLFVFDKPQTSALSSRRGSISITGTAIIHAESCPNMSEEIAALSVTSHENNAKLQQLIKKGRRAIDCLKNHLRQYCDNVIVGEFKTLLKSKLQTLKSYKENIISKVDQRYFEMSKMKVEPKFNDAKINSLSEYFDFSKILNWKGECIKNIELVEKKLVDILYEIEALEKKVELVMEEDKTWTLNDDHLINTELEAEGPEKEKEYSILLGNKYFEVRSRTNMLVKNISNIQINVKKIRDKRGKILEGIFSKIEHEVSFLEIFNEFPLKYKDFVQEIDRRAVVLTNFWATLTRLREIENEENIMRRRFLEIYGRWLPKNVFPFLSNDLEIISGNFDRMLNQLSVNLGEVSIQITKDEIQSTSKEIAEFIFGEKLAHEQELTKVREAMGRSEETIKTLNAILTEEKGKAHRLLFEKSEAETLLRNYQSQVHDLRSQINDLTSISLNLSQIQTTPNPDNSEFKRECLSVLVKQTFCSEKIAERLAVTKDADFIRYFETILQKRRENSIILNSPAVGDLILCLSAEGSGYIALNLFSKEDKVFKVNLLGSSQNIPSRSIVIAQVLKIAERGILAEVKPELEDSILIEAKHILEL